MPDLLDEVVQHRALERIHAALERHDREVAARRASPGRQPPVPQPAVRASAMRWYREIEADLMEQGISDAE